jgi:hypothetical protein
VQDTKEGDLSDPDLVAEILARLAAGETTRAVTRGISAKIERQFWARMQSDKDFAASVARAREAGQDAMTAETIDIADEATEENVQSARLRIWARQWYASKLAPKKYGDKLALGGADDLGPVQLTWKSRSPTPQETKP